MSGLRLGTAGWSIPPCAAAAFGKDGSHLQRYAHALDAVEVNSSFYRPHRAATYVRWAQSVPTDFRFALKLPREITHSRRLVGTAEALTRFLADSAGLGPRRGPLLIQLPPGLAFDCSVVSRFLDDLRARTEGLATCEPRHPSWFCNAADALLCRYRVGRVAADPPRAPGADEPGGWPGIAYYRLHGSPRIYYSSYAPGYLGALAANLVAAVGAEVWCIFDNTAAGAAAANVLQVKEELRHRNLLARGPLADASITLC